MPESTFRFVLPYMGEVKRQAYLVANKAEECRNTIQVYGQAAQNEADPVAPVAAIEELVNAATSLLLTVRAAAMSAGVGQNRWVV